MSMIVVLDAAHEDIDKEATMKVLSLVHIVTVKMGIQGQLYVPLPPMLSNTTFSHLNLPELSHDSVQISNK